ncbi:hypothetical protein [Brevundimonas balnearis]|uniref:Uncharacterized protein n=1 Tax=Brevundimonas balnearis TaxID=1572858 RepID=A0ABV6R5S8_9CAUL
MHPARSLRAAYAALIEDVAEEQGATHWGVLKIGYLGWPHVDVERDLLKPLRVLFRQYGYVRSGLRKRASLAAEHLAPVVGAVELYDKAGNHDPHLNYFITLGPDEEPRWRGFLRERFGRDATHGADVLEAVVCPAGTDWRLRPFLPLEPIANRPRAPRPIIHRGAVEPSFDLQRLRSDWRRAASYSVKQASTDTILTHNDFL